MNKKNGKKMDGVWWFIWQYCNGLCGLWPSILLDAALVVPIVIAAAFFGGPLVGVVALAIPIYSAASFYREYLRRKHNTPHKGRRVLKHRYARLLADRARKKIDPDDAGLLFGKVRLPAAEAVKGFCVVGNIGSGKSLTIKMLIASVFPKFAEYSDARALVIDLKGEYLPYLLGLRLSVPVVVVNPFDMRGTAWDLAADISTQIEARDLARQLAPPSKNATHRFFEDAIVSIATAILTVLIKVNPGRWTLRQFLLIMRSDELIRKIAALDDSAKETTERFFKMSGEGRGNVLASIEAKLSHWSEVAACWQRAPQKISLKHWLQRGSEAILVFGVYEGAHHSCQLVMQMMFESMAKFALSLPDSDRRRIWSVVDETSEAGDLSGLQSLILRGRSKGCCNILGFQDIVAMWDTYGKERATALVAQCDNKAFLKSSSQECGDWSSDVINKTIGDWMNVLDEEKDKSRAAFPPEYFMNVPPASRQQGMSGVFLSPSVGCWPAHYSPDELNQYLGSYPQADEASAAGGDFSPFEMVPPSHMALAPWTEADSRQFGIEDPEPEQNCGDDWDGVDDVRL